MKTDELKKENEMGNPLWFRVVLRLPEPIRERVIGWLCWYGDNQRRGEVCYECGKTVRWYRAVYEQYQHYSGDYDTHAYCRRCARNLGVNR
uniref:Uncharacterized protein n=1 Tax=viral metagenome TaxID=1070528 RepID=A0A6M3JLP1_9ZZZZ